MHFISPILVTLAALIVSLAAYSQVDSLRSCSAIFQSHRSVLPVARALPSLEPVTRLLREMGFDEFAEGAAGESLLRRIARENPATLLWYIQKIKTVETRLSVRNPEEIVEALNQLTSVQRPQCRGGNCRPESFRTESCHVNACTSRLVSGYLITGEERLRFESKVAISLFGHSLNVWVSEAVMMDVLTGALLPHGVGTKALNEIIASAQNSKKPTAFIFVDLNDLGKVNYFHNGFTDGNAYISAVGRILKESVRTGETFIRIGGDEFVLLLKGLSAPEVRSLSQRVIDTVAHDADAQAVFERQWRYVESKISEIRGARAKTELSADFGRFIQAFKEDFARALAGRGAESVTFERFRSDALEILERWLAKQKILLAPNVSVGSTFVRSGDTLDSLIYRASCNANECKRLHKEALGTDARKYGGAPENQDVIQQNIRAHFRPVPQALDPDHINTEPTSPKVESPEDAFDYQSLYGN